MLVKKYIEINEFKTHCQSGTNLVKRWQVWSASRFPQHVERAEISILSIIYSTSSEYVRL